MKEWIKSIALALVIALAVIFFIKPMLVKQSSMEPNFYENDYLFASKQAYTLFGSPERGDVVVFHSDLVQENGDEKMLIKRIIGLPGDTITITDDTVYINGEALQEDYVKEKGTNNAQGNGVTDPGGAGGFLLLHGRQPAGQRRQQGSQRGLCQPGPAHRQGGAAAVSVQ